MGSEAAACGPEKAVTQGRPGGAGAERYVSCGRCPPIRMRFYLTHDLRLLKLLLFWLQNVPGLTLLYCKIYFITSLGGHPRREQATTYCQ